MIRIAVIAIVILLFCGLIYGAFFWVLRNPVFHRADAPPPASADPARLEADVRHLAASDPARAYHNAAALDRAAQFIEDQFTAAGCTADRQSFEVGGDQYHNIICSLGPQDSPRLVVGAHYDVEGDDNPGADDNASGIAGILELARLINLKSPDLKYRLDLVAWTLEEPPNFKSANMGSYVHAERLVKEGAEVELTISVEMIGYFSDTPGSQQYPLSPLKWLYPDKGDFIGVVGMTFDRKNVARVKTLMAQSSPLPVYSINAPAAIPGVDFSDHWSFWQLGLPAVMVTDTAFLRNPNYHTSGDTPDTLDYRRMAQVVDGLYGVIVGY